MLCHLEAGAALISAAFPSHLYEKINLDATISLYEFKSQNA